MARSDLHPIFEAVGLPVVMGHWAPDEKPVWPFIEYHIDGDNDVIADNKNYKKFDAWSVNVYSKTTDMAGYYEHCEALEEALSDSDIVYDRSMDIFTGEDTVYAEFTFTLPR